MDGGTEKNKGVEIAVISGVENSPAKQQRHHSIKKRGEQETGMKLHGKQVSSDEVGVEQLKKNQPPGCEGVK